MRWRLWRNRQIASPRFRSLIARLPLTRWIAQRKANQLFRLTAGFVYSQVLHACVKLDVFQRLEDQILSTDQLATFCQLSTPRMRLLLENAACLGLVLQPTRDIWMLDDAGAVIASDAGLRAMIRHHDALYRDLVDPVALWRSEMPETELRRYWAYVRGDAPSAVTAEQAAPYSLLMRESQAMFADCILASYDFGRHASLLDVGGGDGAFLSAVGRKHPNLQLALFDLPAVTERASKHLTEAGLMARSSVYAGDFSTDALPGSADCVTLLRILCDHDDDRVITILTNLHGHLAPNTRLLVAEAMADPSEGARLASGYFGVYFLAMGSGRCRSADEIMSLLRTAGFRETEALATTNPLIATLVTAIR
ncbi:methyltransferase [Rhizobium sp. Root274]|nr:methyltransferase [Rhizobium sp. Root1240]KRD29991.1 methyltransferase [Rhizobium sp. Root274]